MIGEHKMGVSLCSIFKAQQCYLCLGVKACQSPQILSGLSDLTPVCCSYQQPLEKIWPGANKINY